MASKQTRMAIIGGGMLGISLANRLSVSHPEYDITIYEAGPSLGGLADAWKLGDVTWDRHYHVISMADMKLRDTLDEIGLANDIKWVETKTGFFSKGKYYSLSNAMQFLKFKPLNLYEKFRLGLTIFFGSKIKNWKPLESISCVKWLEKWSGRSTTRKIWIPLLKSKLGDFYERAPAAFIWAYIDRMYRARRTGLKKEMFGYVPGGYKTILDRFESVLTERGVSINVGAPVTRVESNSDQTLSVTVGDNQTQVFDKVVVTTATPVVERICPQLNETEKRQFGDIGYLGIVCASVLLKRPLDGYYVTNILDPVPITAVIEMSAIVDPQELGGYHLVYLPKYCTADDPIVGKSDDEIEKLFLDTLKRMHPTVTDDDIVEFRLSRVRDVMALPTMNYSEKLPPMLTSIPGLYAVNSAHILGGILNVNETIGIAEDSVELVTSPIQSHVGATEKAAQPVEAAVR